MTEEEWGWGPAACSWRQMAARWCTLPCYRPAAGGWTNWDSPVAGQLQWRTVAGSHTAVVAAWPAEWAELPGRSRQWPCCLAGLQSSGAAAAVATVPRRLFGSLELKNGPAVFAAVVGSVVVLVEVWVSAGLQLQGGTGNWRQTTRRDGTQLLCREEGGRVEEKEMSGREEVKGKNGAKAPMARHSITTGQNGILC